MGTRRIVVGGREIVVPSETTGREIKTIAGVPANRNIIRQDGKGSVRVKDDERITVSPDALFENIPKLIFG